jgi:riboflavin synthase
MFTGIVTDLGMVRRVGGGGILGLTIGTRYDTATIAIGASIACSGACLTVVATERGAFSVEVSGETLLRTTLGGWREGTLVNLERPLKLGDDLGGHIVLGHIDGVARIIERREGADPVRFLFEAPPALSRFIAEKGSVALDGVSLTVNETEGCRFGVAIIPRTLAHTNFGRAAIGQKMNLEIDPLARYLARLADLGTAPEPFRPRER